MIEPSEDFLSWSPLYIQSVYISWFFCSWIFKYLEINLFEIDIKKNCKWISYVSQWSQWVYLSHLLSFEGFFKLWYHLAVFFLYNFNVKTWASNVKVIIDYWNTLRNINEQTKDGKLRHTPKLANKRVQYQLFVKVS